MKKFAFYITFIALTAALHSCNEKQEVCTKINPLEGTWRLAVSNEIELPDSANRIKIINKTHFMWMDDFSLGGLSGTYTASDSIYTESIAYTTPVMSSFRGCQATVSYRIKADTLYTSGALNDSIKIKETWIKIK